MHGRLFTLACLLFTCVLELVAATATSAQEKTESPETNAELRVARLIRDLGADSFAIRNRADAELSKLGPEARRQIEVATRSDDPEVRLRAKDLLAQIKVYELWSASKVHCPQETLPASKLLEKLAEQTGNHVLVGDQFGAFHDQDLKLARAEGPFWEVLDALCAASENHYRPHYDSRSPGVVVVSGAPGKQPLAYAGPVRGRITSARRVFIEELNYEDVNSEKTHTFQLNLEMMWEDRFRLVAYRSQPELVEARTDTGAQLTATQASASGWNVANAGSRQLTMNLRLHPPSPAARELDALKLKWGLIAVGDMAAIDITNMASKEPHFQDDVELVVESFQAGAGARYEATLVLSRNRVLPEPQEVLLQEHELDLFDEANRPFRKQGQSNTLTEHGARLKLTFVGETETSSPKLLRFTYPRVRAQKDLEIVFRHVPLPTGRPE